MKNSLPLVCTGVLLMGLAFRAYADDATNTPPPAVAPATPAAPAAPLPLGTLISPEMQMQIPPSVTQPTGPVTVPPLMSSSPPYPTTKRSKPKPTVVVPIPKPPGKTMIEKQLEFIQEHKNDAQKYEPPNITHEPVEIRACTDGDIISGVWKMIYSRMDPPQMRNRFNSRLKYQYLSFNATHNYTRLKTSVEITDPKKVAGLLGSRGNAQYSQKYALVEKDNKTEMVFIEGKQPLSRQSCAIVVKPLNLFKPNDLILTGYTPDGKSLSYELYRRWF